MDSVIIIPARYDSTRLPGKPLHPIAGKAMIQRVYELANAVKNADAVYVATDDERIVEFVDGFGGKSIMTSKTCRNGSDRCFAAAENLPEKPKFVVNFQGDSPLIPPIFIEKVIDELKTNGDVQIATPAIRVTEETYKHYQQDMAANKAGGTTVVFKKNGDAMYFSKAPIPFLRDYDPADPLPVFKHIGIYGYRYNALETYVGLTPTQLEQIEGLEQLRAMENDIPIRVVTIDPFDRTIWGVDSPQDVERAEAIIAREGEIL